VALVAVACGLFVLLGALLVPRAGIQNDEALFSSPLFNTLDVSPLRRLLHLDVPLMVMSYLGSLKSLLYIPILGLFGSSVWAVRLPMVLAGAATVWFFYQLVRELLGPRAALWGAFLLATDPLFVMTDTFDWGPVALEHFFLVTGCWALCRFGQTYDSGTHPGPFWHSRERWLVLGFGCFGLGLWNKAIFAWALAGLGVGVVATAWGMVRRNLTRRNVAMAAVAFVVGAFPLIAYNLRAKGATVSENAHLSIGELPAKVGQLESALQGSGVFGYIAAEEWTEPLKQPGTPLERASVWVRDRIGEHRRSGFAWVLAGLVVLAPLWWRCRVAWFALLFSATAWGLMASTQGAGASAHHVVLLWPMPLLFALAAGRRMPGWLWSLGAGAVIVSNLLVINQFYSQLVRNGAWDTWTDAVLALSADIEEKPGQTVYITDWGMFDSLNLLHQGRLKLRIASGPLQPDQPSQAEIEDLNRMLRDPDAIFVGHVAEREAFRGVGAHLQARAAAIGLRREVLRVVADSNGRPVFEVSRMAPPN
jgi:hypothetical protein